MNSQNASFFEDLLKNLCYNKIICIGIENRKRSAVEKQNDSWKSQKGYIYSMLGSAVGFANILSFGAKSYQNGGGAFLIPLFVAILTLGFPMLVLEGLVGKTFKRPLVSSFGAILGAKGKFLAWPTVFGVLTIGGFYTVINSWTLAYVWFGASGSIPEAAESFFQENFLGVTSSIGELGHFSWLIGIVSCVLLASIFIINSSPISKGIERISKILLPVLVGLLGIFLVTVFFLPGATQGMLQFVIPDFSRLSDGKLWLSAFGHVFFSLSIGLAIISGYSTYVDEDINITKSMILVALGDLMTSMVSGLIIFGCLGHLSFATGKEFSEVVSTSGFGLGFVVFPKLLQMFPIYIERIISPLFFMTLFLAGVTGLMSIVEAAVGNLKSELKMSRKGATFFACVLISVLAVGFSFGNAIHLIEALDYMASGVNVLMSGLLQIFIFLYCTKIFSESGEWLIQGKRGLHFFFLKFFSPFVIFSILVEQVYSVFLKPFDAIQYVRWGWFLLVLLGSSLLTQITCRRDS